MSKIDWDKPIELVTPGGAIYSARFVTKRQTGKDQGALRVVLYLSGVEEIVVYCFENGTIENSLGKTVVRNKKEKKKITIHVYRTMQNDTIYALNAEYTQSPDHAEIIDTIEREYEI